MIDINTPKAKKTVDEIADQIIESLDLEERVSLSNLPISEVKILQTILGMYTERQLENYYIDENYQDPDGPYGSANIIERVCDKLRESHKLRSVK